MKSECETLIIGAGMAGLAAARELVRGGSEVIVIDKGRGVGGRMATRRFAGARFDHGAQFVSVRSSEFAGLVNRLVDDGVMTVWAHGFPDGLTGDGSLLTATAGASPVAHRPARDGHPRYRGVPAMNSIPKALADGLDVRLDVQAVAVREEDGGWSVDAEGGQRYRSRSVIVTAPVPQSLALLAAGGVEVAPAARGRLEQIDYAPCLALLARCDAPVALPEPGVLRRPTKTIEWIADNAAKGVTDGSPALTVHYAPGFSAEHYEEGEEAVAELMIGELCSVLPVEIGTHQVKRWRFSSPIGPLSVGAWTEGLPPGIVIAGDALAGARVEGAALSGMAAARAVR
ncbi:MAG: NAD(P)/FAD-dependent oxidoreductase [Spirochaetota bacterium]